MKTESGFPHINYMFDQDEKLKEIFNSEKLEIEFAMNILINAVGSNWGSYNKIDQYLIMRSLQTFKHYSDNKKDIVIKFKKD